MTWKDLLAANHAEPHATSKQELDDLRNAVRRNLADAALQGLSADNKFGLAYEAGLLLAKMAVASAGYRITGQGAHKNTFLAMKLAMGDSVSATVSYLDRCRRMRNEISYDVAGVASESQAREILVEVVKFQKNVESWIAKNHPSLRAEKQ